MEKFFVILVAVCLFSGACCISSEPNRTSEPALEAGSGATSIVDPKTVNAITSIINLSNATAANSSTTLTPEPKPSDVTPNTTTTATTLPTTPPTTSASTTTDSPPTTPTTTTPPPTTASTTTLTPTTTTSAKTTNATSSTTTPTSPSTTPLPTPVPSKDRRFDGPSFIGGIVLSLGIMAIAFVAFKFYKARTERNYHTL